MYDYNICTQADDDVFKRQCVLLEKNIPGLVVVNDLRDVDDSNIKIYSLSGKTVTIYNDYFIDAVYVRSEVDLLPFFKQE